LNIEAPVADTWASTLDVTVNGPTACPGPTRPVWLDGEIVRLGGGGCSIGPLLITAAAIAATAL
jgi:hypothetical protein